MGDPRTIPGKGVRTDPSWAEHAAGWSLQQRVPRFSLHTDWRGHSARPTSFLSGSGAKQYLAHSRFSEKLRGVVLFSLLPATEAPLCREHLTRITSRPHHSRRRCYYPHFTVIILILQKTGSKPKHKTPVATAGRDTVRTWGTVGSSVHCQ